MDHALLVLLVPDRCSCLRAKAFQQDGSLCQIILLLNAGVQDVRLAMDLGVPGHARLDGFVRQSSELLQLLSSQYRTQRRSLGGKEMVDDGLQGQVLHLHVSFLMNGW
jgi:hypothetical protein